MNKDKARVKMGFEVLRKDHNSVTFKRVIPLKQRKEKTVREIELNLNKVTVKYFDKEDLINLQKIGDEIYETYNKKIKKNHQKILGNILDFVIK